MVFLSIEQIFIYLSTSTVRSWWVSVEWWQLVAAIHDEGDGLMLCERHSDAYDHMNTFLFYHGWNWHIVYHQTVFVGFPSQFHGCCPNRWWFLWVSPALWQLADHHCVFWWTAGILIEEKNWPPFLPILHHSIAKDIPLHTQRIQYFAYGSWLGTKLFILTASCDVIWIVSSDVVDFSM